MKQSLISFYFFIAVQIFSFSAFAQPFQQNFRPFPVTQSGTALTNPFSGGINTPIFQFVDIDGDGDLDLFILDRERRLSFYRNDGTPSSPNFVLVTNDFQHLNVGSWFRFVDIDGDGDYDLFCNGPSATVNFYRNAGTRTSPQFVLETAGLKDVNGNLMISEEISVPAFADLDGDGDFDFFSGNSLGTIWYYENVGTRTNFAFRFVTDRYQGIQIIGVVGKTAQNSLHGAMAITFADIDGDGDLDLFWGDFFNKSLYFIENRGTPTNPQLVLRDSTYPKPNVVMTNGFNMPQLVDIDNNSTLDLFIGVLYGAPTVDNFRFYRNIGSKTAPNFQLETLNFLPTIDVGTASSPVFADVDGDGDLDLLIGSEDGKLALYERKGTATNPIFELKTNQFVNLAGFFNISPTFGDIDGDGKLDLIVGEANGKLHLYRGSDLFSREDTTFQLRSVSFGQNAAPVLVDIDKDGKLDLFVGTGGGTIAYYKNMGTVTSPNFVLQTTSFLSIDVGDDAKPTFVDLDNDGNLDLVVGSRDSSLFYWHNNGGLSFTSIDNFFGSILVSERTAPAFVDVDGDGGPDLFLGNIKGGLYFYENKRVSSAVPMTDHPLTFALRQNYPNPFNPMTNIEFEVPSSEFVTLEIFNVLGIKIATVVNEEKVSGRYTVPFDARSLKSGDLPSGIYFYRLSAGRFVQTRKMILLR